MDVKSFSTPCKASSLILSQLNSSISRVFTVPSNAYNASQKYGRLRNASVNRKNREAKLYRH